MSHMAKHTPKEIKRIAKKNRNVRLIAILMLIIYVFIIVILRLPPSLPKVSTSDFSISSFSYKSSGQPIYYDWYLQSDASYSEIVIRGSFIISTDKGGLYYRLYDINNKDILGGIVSPLQMGDNIVGGGDGIPLESDSLNQQPQIQVCIGNKYDFSKYSPNSICKIETFPALIVNVSVGPDPVTFTTSIEQVNPTNYNQIITVTNTGNIETIFYVYPPSSAGPYPYDYPKSYPQYAPPYATLTPQELQDVQDGITLAPGQSSTYLIRVMAGYAPVGIYNSTGYVLAIPTDNSYGALFKKEFRLITTVTNITE